MAIYAIAAGLNKENKQFIRLFDNITGRAHNADFESLSRLKIRNLSLEGNKIKWTSGNITRYPFIDNINAKLTNSNCVTVVGILEYKDGDKKYYLVDYKGNTAVLSEKDTVLFAMKNGLTNCKLCEKDGTYYIQSISGEISKMPTDTKIYSDVYGTINIRLPVDCSVETITIPSIIQYEPIDKYEYINILPTNAAMKVKKVIFELAPKSLQSSLVSSLKYVKEIEFNRDYMIFTSDCFRDMSNIEKVTVNGDCVICSRAFKGCIKLREFKCTGGITNITSGAFNECYRLNVQSVLDNNIGDLGDAFKGCSADELIIRSNIDKLGNIAFSGLTKLNKITVDSMKTYVYNYSNRVCKYNLVDFNSADLYLREYSAIAEILKEKDKLDNPNIHFIVDEKTKDNEAAYLKSHILGFSGSGLVADNVESVKFAVNSVSQEELTRVLLSKLKENMSNRNYRYDTSSVQLGKYSVKVDWYTNYILCGRYSRVFLNDNIVVAIAKSRNEVCTINLNKSCILKKITWNSISFNNNTDYSQSDLKIKASDIVNCKWDELGERVILIDKNGKTDTM